MSRRTIRLMGGWFTIKTRGKKRVSIEIRTTTGDILDLDVTADRAREIANALNEMADASLSRYGTEI